MRTPTDPVRGLGAGALLVPPTYDEDSPAFVLVTAVLSWSPRGAPLPLPTRALTQPNRPGPTGPDGVGANAPSTSNFCSFSWTWCDPVAGLALASRPTYSKGKFIARSRGSANVQPPMFCDSSCTHTHSRARRYLPSAAANCDSGHG